MYYIAVLLIMVISKTLAIYLMHNHKKITFYTKELSFEHTNTSYSSQRKGK
jgi:hypothetical protein